MVQKLILQMAVCASNCLILERLRSLLLILFIMGDSNLSFKQSLGLSSAGSAIGTAFGSAGAAISSALQYRNWKKQFDLQNAYNSPKAQLERLYDAGINPLYNSDFSGNSAASLSAAAPAVQPNNPAFVEDFVRFREAKFNQSLEDVQREYWKYKAEHEKQAARESGANADAIPIRTKAEFSESVARCENLFSQTDKNKEEIAEIRANITRNNAYLDLQMQDLKLRIAYFFFENQKFDFEKEWRTYANATDRMQAVNAQNLTTLESNKFEWQKGQDVIQRAQGWAGIRQNQQQINQRSKEIVLKAEQLDLDKFKTFLDAGKGTTSILYGLISEGRSVNVAAVKTAQSEYESIIGALQSPKISDEKKVLLQKRAENLGSSIDNALNLAASARQYRQQRKRTDLDFVGNSQPYKIGLSN